MPNTGITKSIRGLWGTGPNDIYAVGEEALVAHYDGIAWNQEAIPTTDALNDVWGSGIDDVYAVSDHAAIYRRSGGRWQEVKPLASESFNAI